MREIKFRAWDKDIKTMYQNWCILPDWKEKNYLLKNGGTLPQETIILMQFTGLKDKNGVEIYEWDILKKAGIVSWNDVEVKWSCIDIEWNDRREWNNMLYLTTPLEVIGNIYENPELLN